MTQTKIETIQSLAAACGVPCDTTIYLPDFETPPATDSLNRIWGSPVGIDEASWPRFDGVGKLLSFGGDPPPGFDPSDTRMEHLFTIDLAGVTGIGAPEGARVLMLFVSCSSYNEAWNPGTRETAVVFLDESAVAKGLCRAPLPARASNDESRSFSLVAVKVPSAVFTASGDDPVLGALRTAVWQAPMRMGGEPIWLQGEEDEDDWGDDGGDDEGGGDDDEGGGDDDDEGGDDEAAGPAAGPPAGWLSGHGYYLQFDESFVSMNLGDCGVMYVFGHGAWFQCY